MSSALAKAGLIDDRCAVLRLIDGDVEQAVCGTLGKWLDAGSEEGFTEGMIAAAFTGDPMLGAFAGGIYFISSKIFGGKEDCGTPAKYFEATISPATTAGLFSA